MIQMQMPKYLCPCTSVPYSTSRYCSCCLTAFCLGIKTLLAYSRVSENASGDLEKLRNFFGNQESGNPVSNKSSHTLVRSELMSAINPFLTTSTVGVNMHDVATKVASIIDMYKFSHWQVDFLYRQVGMSASWHDDHEPLMFAEFQLICCIFHSCSSVHFVLNYQTTC